MTSLAAQSRFTQAPKSLTVTIPEDSTQKAGAALGFLARQLRLVVSQHVGRGDSQPPLYEARGERALPPDGGVAKVSQLEAYATAVNVTGKDMPNGVSYLRIAPGDAAHSLVPLMAVSRNQDAGGFEPMPPLVSHIPDDAGIALVNAWINALGDAGAPLVHRPCPLWLERVEPVVRPYDRASVHENGDREVTRARYHVRSRDHGSSRLQIPCVQLTTPGPAHGPDVRAHGPNQRVVGAVAGRDGR